MQVMTKAELECRATELEVILDSDCEDDEILIPVEDELCMIYMTLRKMRELDKE